MSSMPKSIWYWKCAHPEATLEKVTIAGTKMMAKICDVCKQKLLDGHTIKLYRASKTRNATQEDILFEEPREAEAEILEGIPRGSLEELGILNDFKDLDPWAGTLEEKREKFKAVHQRLVVLYEIPDWKLDLHLTYETSEQGTSKRSIIVEDLKTIVMIGKLSVLTYLNRLGQILEWPRCKNWRLFKEVFPEDFARLTLPYYCRGEV